MVKSIRQKKSRLKNRIGIDKFDMELTPCLVPIYPGIRVGKFMTQCQKPRINPGFMMSCHKHVYDMISS